MTERIIVRVSSETREKVARRARAEGKTSSQVIRELIDRHIREREFTGHIDDLWARTGNKLRAEGASEGDIADAISAVRRERDARRH